MPSIVLLSLLAATVQVVPSIPARPLSEPGSWISSNDYPPDAVRRHVQGEARFTLRIDPTGRVSDCTITQSTGDDALDRTTCTLLLARAQFTPARNAAGEAIETMFRSSVFWQIPTPQPIVAGFAQADFDVMPDGTTENCKAQFTPGFIAGPANGSTAEEWCNQIATTPVAPLPGADGKPTQWHVRTRFSIDLSRSTTTAAPTSASPR